MTGRPVIIPGTSLPWIIARIIDTVIARIGVIIVAGLDRYDDAVCRASQEIGDDE